ncbi:MAG: sugar phosphate isomerase/epimerase [Chloroflexi bacterium]|nr:sugar phosphate isomerase/epimerase [Chloroflexota bacterium]
MYYAMDDMGDDNVKTLMEARNTSEKWGLIHRVASGFGFTGIQLGHKYQDTFGLSLTDIPDFIRSSFRLTYHPGGIENVLQLNNDDDEQRWRKLLSESLDIAAATGVEDVSLHPPVLADLSQLPLLNEDKSSKRSMKIKERLSTVLSSWLPRFQDNGITLSLETHVTPRVFAFSGIQDFHDFVLSLPGLGVLIDVSHNYYDGYDVAEVIATLKPLTITGFHLSDAVRGRELRDGNHLVIGQGHVDFKSVRELFDADNTVYGALEVKGPACGITDSLARLHTLE